MRGFERYVHVCQEQCRSRVYMVNMDHLTVPLQQYIQKIQLAHQKPQTMAKMIKLGFRKILASGTLYDQTRTQNKIIFQLNHFQSAQNMNIVHKIIVKNPLPRNDKICRLIEGNVMLDTSYTNIRIRKGSLIRLRQGF